MSVSSNNTLGKYRIVREIARSNDIVHEAIDPGMGRRVAIKELLIPQHLSESQRGERIQRFYREAKAAGTLAHPNIVTIYDVGNDKERHYIAMEYLEGYSLRDVIRMRGALPMAESIEIALQLCDALGYAHAHGVVHRDVKPDNVHVLSGGGVKLTDFGIAAIAAEPSITAQGQVFGTPSYMSPEQVASNIVDHRSDIFSFGVLLYEVITGRKPFFGDSVITITYNIMNTDPLIPSTLNANMQNIIKRALAKDPSMRYQTMQNLAADLKAEKYGIVSGFVAPLRSDARTQQTGSLNNRTSNMGMNPSGTQMSQSPPQTQMFTQGHSSRLAHHGDLDLGRAPGMTQGTRNALAIAFGIFGITAIAGVIVWIILLLTAHTQSIQARNLYNRGRAEFQAGQFNQAARDYALAHQAAPDSDIGKQAAQAQSTSDLKRGNQAASTNNASAATSAYRAAVSADPKSAAAFDSLGNSQAQSGDVTDALASWQNAMNADRSSPYAVDAQHNATQEYANLAQQADTKGDHSTALADWQHVIELSPGTPEAQRAQDGINGSTITPANGNNPMLSSPNAIPSIPN